MKYSKVIYLFVLVSFIIFILVVIGIHFLFKKHITNTCNPSCKNPDNCKDGNCQCTTNDDCQSGQICNIYNNCRNTILSVGKSVACSGNMWVAVGKGPLTSIAYSTDGKIWNAATGFVFTDIGNGIAYNTTYKTWVAVGDDPHNPIAYSNDGMYWYSATVNNLFSIGLTVATNNEDLWIAGALRDNNIAYSDDPSLLGNWNALNVSQDISFISSVVYNKNKDIWVAVGGKFIAWASDTPNWTISKVNHDLRGVNCDVDGGLWFAIGQQYNIYKSSDGKDWSHIGSISKEHAYGFGIYINKNIIIAFGDHDESYDESCIYYSEDKGETWKPAQFNPATSRLYVTNSIAYNDTTNMFIAVGSNSDTGNSLAYSTDGKTWNTSVIA
jgi:hypothetical protein